MKIRLNLFGKDEGYFFEIDAGRFKLTLYRRCAPYLCITYARKGCVPAGNMDDWCQWAFYEIRGMVFKWWKY